MTFSIVQLFFFQLVLPVVFIGSLLLSKFKGRLDWLLQALFYTTYISWVFFSGRWDWTSYYLRYLWPVLLMIVLFLSWRRVRVVVPVKKYSGKDKGAFAFYILLTGIFILYHGTIFSGYSSDEQAVELQFPLQNGTYYVGQGGASSDINHHYEHPEQQYALDIVQLNRLGVRSAGLYPEDVNEYVIYDAELTSPCSGGVVIARNDIPDLPPPETSLGQLEGNYVQISCKQDAVNVVIAHMQEGSVMVEAGDQVKTGQSIGLVGNSGNTSEPHLHIHAEKNGQGVPMEFDGQFLVRNSLVRE